MYIQTAIKHIIFELYLAINHPANGSDTNEPIGSPISTVPSSASVKFRSFLKSGILVAHVAKFIPHKKNKIPIPNLVLNIIEL